MLEVLLQTQVHSRAVPQPAVAGSPVGQRTIGPALSGFGRVGFTWLSRALATPCGGLGACGLTSVAS